MTKGIKRGARKNIASMLLFPYWLQNFSHSEMIKRFPSGQSSLYTKTVSVLIELLMLISSLERNFFAHNKGDIHLLHMLNVSTGLRRANRKVYASFINAYSEGLIKSFACSVCLLLNSRFEANLCFYSVLSPEYIRRRMEKAQVVEWKSFEAPK